tara:strand:- start:268 stop:690 length:423 start_codon:yes stop_codon:yes gene_type:complete
MFDFFNKNNSTETKNTSVNSIACLLIHAARIDQNYSTKEKSIIKKTLIKLGTNELNVSKIIEDAEITEQNSNQILEFTKDAKNLDYEKKVLLIEALWEIICSDEDADMYETNLMRRLSGLLYLDNKLVGDIKKKILNKKL